MKEKNFFLRLKASSPMFLEKTDVSITSILSLRKKSPYSELFWSAYSRIRTEYWEILRISPYSVQMRENADQSNYKYGHFSRRVYRNRSFSVELNTNILSSFIDHIFFIHKKVWICSLYKDLIRQLTPYNVCFSSWYISFLCSLLSSFHFLLAF